MRTRQRGEMASARRRRVSRRRPATVARASADEELGQERPTIDVSASEHLQTTQSIAALGTSSRLYQRGPCVVTIAHAPGPSSSVSRPAGTAVICVAQSALVRDELSRCARYIRVTASGAQPVHVPRWLAPMVLARREWHSLRLLLALSHYPLVTRDGRTRTLPGYDPETRVYCVPSIEIEPMPASIARDEARLSARDLVATVRQFPFSGEAEPAAWLAALLTPLARHAFVGPAPMLVVDANVRGAGKTLLVESIALILTGQPMPRMVRASSPDEERKRVLAIADAGDPLVLIDNVDAPLGGSAIDAALTATVWRDRRLGATEMVSVPLLATWYATGNNISLRGDTSRRVMYVRLRSPHEHPEERDDLVHQDLSDWIITNRSALLRHALIVLCAYLRAGAPVQGLRPWGSYESWSQIVRGAVVWAGLPDPGESRVHAAQSLDRDRELLEDILEGLTQLDPDGLGLTVGAVCDRLADSSPDFDRLRAALLELAPSASQQLDPRRIGNALKRYYERVQGGRMLSQLAKSARGVRWVVLSAGATGHDAGDAADAAEPSHGRPRQAAVGAALPSSLTSVIESLGPGSVNRRRDDS